MGPDDARAGRLPGKMGWPPMPPIRLDHIAIAMPRIADASAALVEVLGGAPEGSQPSGTFRWATWTFAGGGAIEILEPLGPDGFLHRFLAGHGPGVHHVTFKVPSLDEASRRAEARGYDVVGRDDSDSSWKEAFLHPKQALGIVVQLVESSAAPPADRPVTAPPGLPAPPAPVRILGLRMRAHSAERALAQWRDVLHGDAGRTADGALVFRWTDSPMRIVVDVDPTAAEGPLAIELASERAVASLEIAGARLGIRFTQRSA
jgi:methylmalonyl-CoA/ethylmalonyl-CoA epimerase